MYNPDGSLSSWGFLCADDDEDAPGKIRRELFKMFLDGATIAAAQQQRLLNVPQSTAEARRYATDYLVQVRMHVKETIERHAGGGWADQAVLFLFSVPTTWMRMETINDFKALIRDAGFGTQGPRHLAQVDLTEAEAAAVAALKTCAISFTTGCFFLTIDAGGGTTDLSLMRITSAHVSLPQISQLAAVNGVGIGSTLIDRAFVRLVAQRLDPWPELRGLLPDNAALRMSRGHHFRTVKHKFGEKVYMQTVFKIPVDGVSYQLTHDGAGIEHGRMLFTK